MPEIEALNLTAQMAHRARGNPISTLPESAISNCYPGLEFDFRNVWKNLFEGVELHEAGLVTQGHSVLHVQPGSLAAAAGVEVFDRLLEVDGRSVQTLVSRSSGPTAVQVALEWANALAHIVSKGGQNVACVFGKPNGLRVQVDLAVRRIFDGVALAEELAEPGALTQSLCSPWQADYRECGCFYWAASRPDFVNVERDQAGGVLGHDWMQRDRSPGATYQPDAGGFSPTHISYDELYAAWEQHLKFIIEGKDKE
jgi:hypothetical protein